MEKYGYDSCESDQNPQDIESQSFSSKNQYYDNQGNLIPKFFSIKLIFRQNGQ